MPIYSLSTAKLKMDIATSPLRFHQVIHVDHPDISGIINAELFRIHYENENQCEASDFSIVSIHEHEDGRYKLLQFDLKHDLTGICSKISLLADQDDTIEFILQLWNTTPKEARYIQFSLPFLSDGQLLGLHECEFRAPAAPFTSSQGESILETHSTCPQVMSFVRADGLGLDLTFDAPSEVNTQNCTKWLPFISSMDKLKNFQARVRLNHYPAAVIRMRFSAIHNGWLETFQMIKKKARAKIDMDLYKRPDFQWYDDVFLHQFTYAYGKEAYNYETNQLCLENILKEGEAFGGYDLICLWHQYPRLGIDERSQWDFFNDFPGGGLIGIKQAAAICHQYGVRLTLPYKPWDAPSNLSMEDVAQKLADIAKETNIDGFFLDTLDNVPPLFRIALDKAKPGCIFCTELHPENGEALEMLTGSWQQSAPLPYQIPILRYVYPEHHSPFISRWSIDSERDDMIKKAILNGSGLVIWQDIFGTWLPFEEYQKNDIKRWKTIWLNHKDHFLSQEAIPIWPAVERDVVINVFPAKESVIFTVYNNSNHEINGELAKLFNVNFQSAIDLWNPSRSVWIKDNRICANLHAKDLAIIKTERLPNA